MQAVYKSRLPQCLKVGVAGKIAAYTRDDGTLTRPMTVKFLTEETYPGERTLTRREVQHQLRALERIGFLLFDERAYVGRNHPREYLVDVNALVRVDLTSATVYPRSDPQRKTERVRWRKGEPMGEPMGELFPGMYLDPDPVPGTPDLDAGLFPSTGSSERNPEQRREEPRAAAQDGATNSGGWIRHQDHAAFEAEVATLPIPGFFASPKVARKFGYRIIDDHSRQIRDGAAGRIPLALFDDWVAALQASLEKEGIVTSEPQCRQAMADCIAQRAMRDRSWDAAADRDRRRDRR